MKVSVILPTYNGSKFIETAIKSVLEQSFSFYEFLIIDDGSTDNSPDIIQKYARKDKRLRYVRQENNLGFQKTLNNGLLLAKGDYIARIDDDDVWIDKHKLKLQVEFLENNPSHVLVGTGYVFVDMAGEEIYRYLPPESDRQIRNVILRANVFLHSAVIFQRNLALELGSYNYEGVHGDDYDLWLKLGTRGKMHNLPIYGVAYNTRHGTISSQNLKAQLLNMIDIIGHYKHNYNFYYYSVARRYLEFIFYGILGISPYSRHKLKIACMINQLYRMQPFKKLETRVG